MQYHYHTEPPLWAERVNDTVTRKTRFGRYAPKPDSADSRLYLRKVVLKPSSLYELGKGGMRPSIEAAESHFTMLGDEGIFVPDGREYYVPKPKKFTLLTQCATVEGITLDQSFKNQKISYLDAEVAQEHCVEAVAAYYDRIEEEGHKWMLDDICDLGQFMVGHTIYDYAGRPPKLYLTNIDPTMQRANPDSLNVVRRQIGAIASSLA